MKKSILVVLVVCTVAIAGYVAYRINLTKGAEASAREYIEAVKERDFATIFALNHRTQKQMNIIARAKESEREGLVKKMYAGSEKAFEVMVPTGDPTLNWAEKFFFIPGMDYRILQVDKETTSSTPSSDYRSKRVASVLVAVSYSNSELAPVYRKKRLKQARLRIDMIQSRDVVKGMQTEPVKEGWLYQWLQVEDGSTLYWASR